VLGEARIVVVAAVMVVGVAGCGGDTDQSASKLTTREAILSDLIHCLDAGGATVTTSTSAFDIEARWGGDPNTHHVSILIVQGPGDEDEERTYYPSTSTLAVTEREQRVVDDCMEKYEE